MHVVAEEPPEGRKSPFLVCFGIVHLRSTKRSNEHPECLNRLLVEKRSRPSFRVPSMVSYGDKSTFCKNLCGKELKAFPGNVQEFAVSGEFRSSKKRSRKERISPGESFIKPFPGRVSMLPVPLEEFFSQEPDRVRGGEKRRRGISSEDTKTFKEKSYGAGVL